MTHFPHKTPTLRSFIHATCLLVFAVLVANCTHAERERQYEHVPAINSSAQLNINTANVDELELLPTVGSKTAQEIISFRERHGPFRRVEDLMLVDGISETKFKKIRHYITAK